MQFRVLVQGLGFLLSVQGLGCSVWALAFTVGLWISNLGFWGLGPPEICV